jgi:hypothetical protein
MKLYKKISVLFVLMVITAALSAQEQNCYITKTFSVEKGTALRLSNKYGNVNIIAAEDDSLKVCATISINQDNKELVQNSMKLINISMNKLKDTIFVSTLFEKKFFSPEFRQGRKSFSIDYLVKAPVYINAGIKDEFGDISIEELSGALTLRLSHGTLSVKKLTRANIKPISTIYVDNGKVDIDDLNWMTISLLNCPAVNIGKAQALMINSSVSKINLGNISSLVSNSKSDSYIIKSINNIVSESAYSQYEIGKLNGQLRSVAAYGSISISELQKTFSNIDIVSDHTQIKIKAAPDISFKADITGTDATVEFPSAIYPGVIKTQTKSSTTLFGIAGVDIESKALIKIRATAGKLTIH